MSNRARNASQRRTTSGISNSLSAARASKGVARNDVLPMIEGVAMHGKHSVRIEGRLLMSPVRKRCSSCKRKTYWLWVAGDFARYRVCWSHMTTAMREQFVRRLP